MLAQELAPLNAQIEQARQKHKALEDELLVVEAELKTFSADRQRFDALRDVCDALDKLVELKADELFWEGISETKDAVGHVERVRGMLPASRGKSAGFWKNRSLSRNRSTSVSTNWTSSTKKSVMRTTEKNSARKSF